MAEPRSASLLDFAIAASAAVVPLMIGIVAFVAVVRPAELDAPGQRGRDDRYVSVRHVAALKTFERAIVPRSGPGARRTSGADVLAGVDACRREWSAPNGVMPWLRRTVTGSAPAEAPADEIARRLDELDAALVDFGARTPPRVAHAVGLDAARWFEAARGALATPLESVDAPGRSFRVRCADLAGALGALRRADAAMLSALAWRGSEGAATLARWPAGQEMQVSARDVTQRNPWGGIAGCVYLDGGDDAPSAPVFVAGARSVQRRVCALAAVRGVADAASAPARVVGIAGEPPRDAVAADPRWSVPPSLATLLQPLESVRQTTGEGYRRRHEDLSGQPWSAPAGTADRVELDGASVQVGYSVDLGIDPSLQALAQKTAACYTGRHDLCAALALRRGEDGAAPLGHLLLEGAMVRMAAVAVIDVASGRIEALAGAMSPCALADASGSARTAGCDARIPYAPRYRPDQLLNPAVYHDAMPASTIKPIMAAAFLSDPRTGPRLLALERAGMQRDGVPARESLRGQLMRSDSARFLDRMFCAEGGFAGCRRPWDVQAAARAFGWDGGCDAGRASCGQADLLFGRDLEAEPALGAPAAMPVAYGRLLSEPLGKRLGAPMHLMAPTALDASVLQRCAAGPDGRRGSADDWARCRGGALVDVVAEGWGQGHARASALGVAGMMATLAAAANGAASVPPPHLVERLHGVRAGGVDLIRAEAARWAGAPRPAPLSRDAAAVVLSGLSYSHRAGTARSACEQVFDAKRCVAIDWLAGKTGTPSFPSDGKTLDDIARACAGGAARTRDAQRGICSSLRPYKWYVATFRSDRSPSGPWSKAIAVLTERNWLLGSGRVHGAGDTGPNPSAEIAMQIVGRTTGFVEAAAP